MSNLQNLPLRDLFTLASLRDQAGKKHLFDDFAQTGQSQTNDSWIEEKVKDGLDQSLPLNPDQIREAIKLVKTGEITDDLKSSLNGALTTVASVPTELLRNPLKIFTSPLNTLTLPTITARNTAKIFVEPNNRTFRLAILAYARMNGINITESNVNDIYNVLDNPSSDNLEELANGGLETIKEEYGLNDLSEALRKFKSLTNQ
jgi:hypothetical protein